MVYVYRRILGTLMVTTLLANALPLALPLAAADHPIGGRVEWAPSGKAASAAFTYDELRQSTGLNKLRLDLGDGRKACLDNLQVGASGQTQRMGYLVSTSATCIPAAQTGSFSYLVTARSVQAPVSSPGVAHVTFELEYAAPGAYVVHWWTTKASSAPLGSGDVRILVQ